MPDRICPLCKQKVSYVRLRCTDCRETKLEESIQEQGLTQLINRAADLNFMLHLPGAAVTWSDMTHEEYVMVRLINTEQSRYTEEKMKEQERKLQQQQLGNRRQR